MKKYSGSILNLFTFNTNRTLIYTENVIFAKLVTSKKIHIHTILMKHVEDLLQLGNPLLCEVSEPVLESELP
jgi:hypothetical protein